MSVLGKTGLDLEDISSIGVIAIVPSPNTSSAESGAIPELSAGKLMRAHYLQHVPFEGLGSIEPWLEGAGYQITRTRFFKAEDLPPVEEIDFLVIMGGPMSVHDQQAYPWLAAEKAFISRAITAGVPTLGVCLGAQLIACSLGGTVFANAAKEIGWLPVRAVKSSKHQGFQFPDEIDVFHWHGETFSLPPGAVLTAESKGCKNQAFQIGTRVIGLQFHLETTASSLQAMIEHCRDELRDGEYIQTAEEMLAVSGERYRSINDLMEQVLEYLLVRNGWPFTQQEGPARNRPARKSRIHDSRSANQDCA